MKGILMLFVSVALLVGCGKDGGEPSEGGKSDKLNVINFTVDRDKIGVNQSVTFRVDPPNNAGDLITYKWITTTPSGGKEEKLTSNNIVKYWATELGSFTIDLIVASKGLEGKAKTTFNTTSNDFGVGIFGNSKDIIEDSKAFDSRYPESGLSSGFYWPFEVDKPSESISFKTGNNYEKYIFVDKKLVAGAKELINEPFRQSANGVDRNYSYGNFLNIVSELNKSFNITVQPVIEWRQGVTDAQKIKYETTGATKNDGIGWAMMNRDINQISASWNNSDKEATAYVKSMGDNSKYELKYVIRKK